MEGMLRRPSGVYVARLTVPVRHRDALGKRFFVKSTGTRVLSVARILVGLILAEWRQKFHELDQMTDTIDARRVVTGDAALLATRYHPIQQAAEVSGLSVHHLLREAATDRLDLFIRIAGVNGYFFQPEAEDYEHEVVGDQLNTVLIVPTKEQLAVDGPPRPMTGLLKLRDPVHYANCLISGTEDSLMTGEIVGRNGLHFVPMDGVDVSVVNLEVDGLQVERLRSTLALSVTPEQVQLAHTALLVKQATAGSTEKISVVINRYMVHRSKSCRSDQARRVRGA
ncbi:MAG: hypothetical protein JO370_03540, partial [Paucibacter sp.]|nr:hypothetical protein [Roseateles sp.]